MKNAIISSPQPRRHIRNLTVPRSWRTMQSMVCKMEQTQLVAQSQPVELFGANGTFSTITNVLLFIIGAIAVIMIVIGGMRYVLSGGDSNQITAAKNTILYAIIGIVVAILAYAAVNFVIGSFAPGSTSGTNV